MSFITAELPSEAASGPSVTTTLADNTLQRGSKKTFDVWARNASGDKIKATVKLNGQKLDPTWDDNEKTSYTLFFTQEGENVVTVSASSDGGKKKELTYHITYQRAAEGEAIGTATWSVEAFTIGCGYLIYPIDMPIYEGETSAEQLIRLLHSNGFTGYYGGIVKSSFYLAYIADGTSSAEKYNGYQKSGAPSNPQSLNLSPCIPSLLVPYLEDTMSFYDPNDYINNWSGYLGEFAFTNGSGWMYSVNNIFPNVGFADSYLSDGDTVRVQFTLGYGADIGGFGAVGTDIPNVDNQPSSGYFYTANKDRLTKAIARARASGLLTRSNVSDAYDSALNVMAALNASQSSVDYAVNALNYAVENPADTAAPPNTGARNDSPAQSTDRTGESQIQENPSVPVSGGNKNSSDNNANFYSAAKSNEYAPGGSKPYSGTAADSADPNSSNNGTVNHGAVTDDPSNKNSSALFGTENLNDKNAESDFSGENHENSDTGYITSDETSKNSEANEISSGSKKDGSGGRSSESNSTHKKSPVNTAAATIAAVLFTVSAAGAVVAVIYYKRKRISVKAIPIEETNAAGNEKSE